MHIFRQYNEYNKVKKMEVHMISNLIKQEKFYIQGVPVSYFAPKAKPYKGTLLYYHGWTSLVENYVFYGQIMATHGLQVLMPEVHEHGERSVTEGYYDDLNNMIETMKITYDEFDQIKTELMERFFIESNRFFIAGHSMGSMITSYLALAHPEFAKAFMFNGLIDTRQVHDDTDDDFVFSPEMDEIIKSHNPYFMLDRLGKCELHFYNGLQDSVVLPQNVQKFQEKIEGTASNSKLNSNFEAFINADLASNADLDLSALKDQIFFNYYFNSGHDLSYKMVRESLEEMLK